MSGTRASEKVGTQGSLGSAAFCGDSILSAKLLLRRDIAARNYGLTSKPTEDKGYLSLV